MLNLSDISKYLSAEMDTNEEREFKKLINKSEKNKEFFNKVKKDWEMIGKYKEKEKEKYNVDSAWNKLYNRLEKDELLNKEDNRIKVNFYRITKIAAIFIIGILLSFFGYYAINNFSPNKIILAETSNNEQVKQIKLKDGSIVYLNVNSKLNYPKQFDNDKRIVEFEGEAFFEIARMPKKPFIIKLKDAEIKVLGTSFNVNTNFKNEKLEVTVKTGKVKLYDTKNIKNSIILEKGQTGSLINNKIEKIKNTDANYLSWKTKYFEFNEETLNTVIKTLNKAYNVNIVFDNNVIANEKISTTFDNENIDTILQILSTSHQLKVVKQKNKIILKRK